MMNHDDRSAQRDEKITLPAVQKPAIFCNPKGVALTGFPYDFIKASIETTFIAPLTQQVVRIAIAKVVLENSLAERSSEMIELYEDLQYRRSRFLNLEAITEFVAKYYERKNLEVPKASASKYRDQFLYEMHVALKCIANTCSHFLEEKDPRLTQLLELTCNPSNIDDFSIGFAAKLLKDLDVTLKQTLLQVFSESLGKLIIDPDINQEREDLISDLSGTKRDARWGMRIAEYTTIVNEIANSVLRKSITSI